MCRWLGYNGDPIAPAELVFNTRHSLIDQSLSAKASTLTTNGDGFGLGWFDHLDQPGLYKHIQPAWNDGNLRDLCEHLLSRCCIAHVRASTGTDIQRSNCHPFRHRRWLFAHNGFIDEFESVRRELAMRVDPALYRFIRGTTDTELMFYLALTHGLDDDVPGAVARMVGEVEAVCAEKGVEGGLKMTLGIADGERLYGFRYASDASPPSLYVARDADCLRAMAPEGLAAAVERFPDNARVVVSEPLSDLPGAWEEVPTSAWLAMADGAITLHDFVPNSG